MEWLKSCLYALIGAGFLLPLVGESTDLQEQKEPLNFQIPTFEMSDFYRPCKREQFLDALYNALSTVGVLAIRSHHLSPIVDEAYRQAEIFFKSDPNFKSRYAAQQAIASCGFIPFSALQQTAAADFKEFYLCGREPSHPPDRWPHQTGFKEALMNARAQFEQEGHVIQESLIEALRLHAKAGDSLQALDQAFEASDVLLIVAYDPDLQQELQQEKPAQTDLFAHPTYPATIVNFFKVFPLTTSMKLAVPVKGPLVDLSLPHEGYVVFIGEALENMTNGLFKSLRDPLTLLHPGKEFLSIELLIQPTADTPLDPLPSCTQLTGGVAKYAAGTGREFSWERWLALGIAPELLSAYAQTGHAERQIQVGREYPQVTQMLLQNNLASPALIRMLEEREYAYFLMSAPCGCNSTASDGSSAMN